MNLFFFIHALVGSLPYARNLAPFVTRTTDYAIIRSASRNGQWRALDQAINCPSGDWLRLESDGRAWTSKAWCHPLDIVRGRLLTNVRLTTPVPDTYVQHLWGGGGMDGNPRVICACLTSRDYRRKGRERKERATSQTSEVGGGSSCASRLSIHLVAALDDDGTHSILDQSRASDLLCVLRFFTSAPHLRVIMATLKRAIGQRRCT